MSDSQPAPITIRRAVADDAAALGELALRSKAHWGYDAAFIEACRADLSVSAADIQRRAVYVAIVQTEIVGFYELDSQGESAELCKLFIASEWIGRGVGARLWRHAVAEAQQRGVHTIEIQSDPFAEPFYRAMGAQRIGESESTVLAGRMLPQMRYVLSEAAE